MCFATAHDTAGCVSGCAHTPRSRREGKSSKPGCKEEGKKGKMALLFLPMFCFRNLGVCGENYKLGYVSNVLWESTSFKVFWNATDC